MSTSSGYVNQGDRSGQGYRLDSKEVVQRGRRREFFGTLAIALGLFAIQFPLQQVATDGWLKSEYDDIPAVVPARLSLIVDAFFIVAYVFVAYRAWGLVRSHRTGPGPRLASKVTLAVVLVGAAMDILEDIRLWYGFGKGSIGTSMRLTYDEALGDWVPLPTGHPWYSWTMIALVGLALVVGIALTWVPGRIPPLTRPMRVADVRSGNDVVITCSGGGIRSSAFSLGGLQVLSREGIYARASAVVGVSGGGYVAAALHTVRWSPSDDESGVHREWPPMPPDQRAFAPESPETRWLRRNTRYVLGSVRVAFQAALSLLFGILVNILLVAIALGGLAWLLGWFYLASGRLHPYDDGVGGSFGGHWYVEELVAGVILAGLLAFLVERAWDRFRTVPTRGRTALRSCCVWLLGAGIALAFLLLAVPELIAEIVEYTASSGSPLAGLLYQLGFVQEDVCMAVLTADPKNSACGVDSAMPAAATGVATLSVVSVAGVISAILGVLASARSAAGSGKSASGGVSGLLSKVWAKVKDPIVPWAAVALVAVIALTVLLRWITRLVSDPDLLQEWHFAAIFGAALIVAKVFTEPNRTSMHHFFRERISHAFLVRRLPDRVEPVPYSRPLRYSQAGPRDDGPRLVTCAIANVTDQDVVPSRRGCTPFVFDHDRIGLTDRVLPEGAALRRSAAYEFAADHGYRDATLPAAVAISAAAFSPLAGRENVRLGPYRAVLALGNARLGVWLPNPIWIDEAGLVRRLLRLGRLDEAWAAWIRLPEDEQQQIAPAGSTTMAHLERGSHWARLRNVLFDVQHTMDSGTVEQQQAVLRAAVESLEAATGERPAIVTLSAAREALQGALVNPTGPREQVYRWAEALRSIFKKPGLTRLVKEAVGRASVYDRFLYVTDGGHYDNLGLIEALRRKPRDIYVLDASNDPEDTFRTLGRAIATARMDLDCEITIDPDGMKRLEKVRAGAAWCQGSYRFPDEVDAKGDRTAGATGTIFFVKAILTDKPGWDVETYAADNLDFPRTSTGNQLYSEFDFEAYRALGSHAVRTMLDSPRYRAEHLRHPRG